MKFNKPITYGSKMLVSMKHYERRIETQEMKFLIQVKGCSKMNIIRNQEITEELQRHNINERLKQNRLKWSKHIDRANQDRLLKKALNK